MSWRYWLGVTAGALLFWCVLDAMQAEHRAWLRFRAAHHCTNAIRRDAGDTVIVQADGSTIIVDGGYEYLWVCDDGSQHWRSD